jgi:Cu(I)/Ag(I) efflux system membrane protein CusA/SilA
VFEPARALEERRLCQVPLTLLLIFLILYLNFQRQTQALIVLLSVPFAAVGSIWLMCLMKFNTS